MGRPLGSKDAHPRSRGKETPEQKIAKKQRKDAAKKVSKAAGRHRMAQALVGGASLLRAGAGAGQNTAAPGSGGATGITGAGVGAGGAAVAGGGVAVAASPAVAAAKGAAPGASSASSDPSRDISASLDDDDHRIPQDSVMGQYLKAVFMRLKFEVSTKFVGLEEDKWLLGMLKDDDWWLRANFAHRVCKRLKLQYTEENKFYFRDIKVWLPDQQWGLKAMPPCVLCKSAANVKIHGFRDNHFGRRICDLDGHYFVISRRYKCTECAKHAKQQQAQALMRAEAVGLHVQGRQRVLDGGDDDDDRRAREEEENDNVNPFSDDRDVGDEKCTEPPYTFMGYDLRSRQLLAHGYGNDFPAFLTHRSGVDLRIIDLLRPLSDKGVRHHAVSEILLEWHSKAYFRAYEKREHLVAEKMEGGLHAQGDFPMFSTFNDPQKWAGAVPTGRFLSTVYKGFGRSIGPHLDNEVKHQISLLMSLMLAMRTRERALCGALCACYQYPRLQPCLNED